MLHSIAFVAAGLAGYATAQSATATLFVGGGNGDYSYAASVVTVNSDATVYAVQCTGGSGQGCGSDGPTVTITEGPSTFVASTATTTTYEGTAITFDIEETCALSGTTAADCSGSGSAQVGGQAVSTSITTSITDASKYYLQVPITGGSLPTSTSSTGAAAAPTNARMVAGMGVAGVLGVAGMMAL